MNNSMGTITFKLGKHNYNCYWKGWLYSILWPKDNIGTKLVGHGEGCCNYWVSDFEGMIQAIDNDEELTRIWK